MASLKTGRLSVDERPQPGRKPLSEIETEVINLFVQLSYLLGLPRSVAEIYGLLYINPEPLAMDHLIERLGLSKGSASQGLRFLRHLGAVKTVYMAGDRRDHYVAEVELRRLLSGFFKDRMGSHFDNSIDRLKRIEALLQQMPEADREQYQQRVHKLRQWEKRGHMFLPLMTKILG